MIKETTGKYKEQLIPYRQKDWEEYDDCYGIYKYAKRNQDDYIVLAQTLDFKEGEYNTEYPKVILRHRYVYLMEVGEISSKVIVHHINHVKGDDRPENLKPLTRREHAIEHAKSVNYRYNYTKFR